MKLQDLLYFTVSEGVNIERNKVTLVFIPGVINRWQVISERLGKHCVKLFREIDPAVELFLELSA